MRVCWLAGSVVDYIRLPKSVQCMPAGNVLPTSEVEQSIIYCQKTKFTEDLQPVAVPLFSANLLWHWHTRFVARCTTFSACRS